MIITYYGSDQSSINSSINVVDRQINDSTKKVGIINWWWLDRDQCNFDNLKKFIESQDICFFLSEEILEKYNGIDLNKLFSFLNQYNVYYILYAEDNTLSVKPDSNKSFYYPWFFKSPLYIPSNFEPDLEYKEKPFTFNLMLGSSKSYRTLSFRALKDNKSIYSSYLGHPKFKNQSNVFLDDEDIQLSLINQNVDIEKLNTMHPIERENENYVVSHCVPKNIYANTHFDIVTETFVKSGHNFLTEKTAKPIATGRFFCWYASPRVIPYLEKYGFIFEYDLLTYDNIDNDVDRLDAFLDLVNEISSDQSFVKHIYTKYSYVRKHNMDVYHKGRKQFYEDLENWILSCLQK